MHTNRLTGELPRSMANLTKLGFLSFYENSGLRPSDDSAFQTWLQSANDVRGDDC